MPEVSAAVSIDDEYSRGKNSGPFMMLGKPLFFWMLKISKITNIITTLQSQFSFII